MEVALGGDVQLTEKTSQGIRLAQSFMPRTTDGAAMTAGLWFVDDMIDPLS